MLQFWKKKTCPNPYKNVQGQVGYSYTYLKNRCTPSALDHSIYAYPSLITYQKIGPLYPNITPNVSLIIAM